jgi:hypothetical protein
MRIISIVACVALSGAAGFAGTGSALAADCNKGMLWPFVRTQGDCLTDAEIASGKTGVYTGPVNTNVDVSTIKPAEIPAQNGGSSGGGGLFSGPLLGGSLFGSGSTSAPSSRGDGALITSSSIFGGGAASPAPTVNCNKGTLWPFNREPGDCLTEAEKKAGKTGVYGGGPGLASVNATAAASDGAQTGAPSATPVAAPAAAPVATCQKGWLWPFVRESNDCPTEAEKKSGKTAVYSAPPSATPVSATAMATVERAPVSTPAPVAVPPAAATPAPASAAATCQKGWLWPFVRDSNDCPSDADRKNGGK